MTEKKSIPFEHITTAFKYAGISFIAGAVNHGFFSEGRSIITAILGILFFSIGTFMTHKHEFDKSLLVEFIIGAIFSIGLGFFTGGLQHFPDSPERSVWVVPSGFLLSLVALVLTKKRNLSKREWMHGSLYSLIVIVLCFGFFRYFESHPSELAHSHEHGQAQGQMQGHEDGHHDGASSTAAETPKVEHQHAPSHSHAPGTKPHND